LLYVSGGIVVMLAGLFFVPAPGPGWLIFFLGLGLLAGEFLYVARFLDWGAVKSRGLARWAAGPWKRSSTAVRVRICAAFLICVVALACGAYCLFFGTRRLTRRHACPRNQPPLKGREDAILDWSLELWGREAWT
jgi:uncharacterized protein (TIGR02611 family)